MKQKVERHARIGELLEYKKSVSIGELSNILGVSSMTVRRDLNELTREGVILRTHGGAILANKDHEPSYVIRSFAQKDEKIEIGMTAAGLIENGDVIAIDTGSTPLEVARFLAEDIDVTILTNFIPVALTLSKKRNVKVLLLGGILRKEELSLVGNSAIETLRNLKIDKYFMGIAGISEGKELMDFDPAEVAVKRAIMEASRRIFLVADHSKFFRSAPTFVAPLSAVQEIITDSNLLPDQLNILEEEGIKITLSNRAANRSTGS